MTDKQTPSTKVTGQKQYFLDSRTPPAAGSSPVVVPAPATAGAVTMSTAVTSGTTSGSTLATVPVTAASTTVASSNTVAVTNSVATVGTENKPASEAYQQSAHKVTVKRYALKRD